MKLIMYSLLIVHSITMLYGASPTNESGKNGQSSVSSSSTNSAAFSQQSATVHEDLDPDLLIKELFGTTPRSPHKSPGSVSSASSSTPSPVMTPRLCASQNTAPHSSQSAAVHEDLNVENLIARYGTAPANHYFNNRGTQSAFPLLSPCEFPGEFASQSAAASHNSHSISAERMPFSSAASVMYPHHSAQQPPLPIPHALYSSWQGRRTPSPSATPTYSCSPTSPAIEEESNTYALRVAVAHLGAEFRYLTKEVKNLRCDFAELLKEIRALRTAKEKTLLARQKKWRNPRSHNFAPENHTPRQ